MTVLYCIGSDMVSQCWPQILGPFVLKSMGENRDFTLQTIISLPFYFRLKKFFDQINENIFLNVDICFSSTFSNWFLARLQIFSGNNYYFFDYLMHRFINEAPWVIDI